MALSQTIFGPPFGGAGTSLDTDNSVVLDGGGGAGPLLVPGGDFVLSAEYDRLGPDLLLSDGGKSVFIREYFSREEAPDLYSTNGDAVVRGSVVEWLAGSATPGQFAQLDGAISAPIVGVVDTLQGEVVLT